MIACRLVAVSWVISIFLRWLDHDVVIGVVQVDVQSAFGTIGGAFCNGLKRLDDFARVSFDDLDLVVSPMLHLSADVGEGCRGCLVHQLNSHHVLL